MGRGLWGRFRRGRRLVSFYFPSSLVVISFLGVLVLDFLDGRAWISSFLSCLISLYGMVLAGIYIVNAEAEAEVRSCTTE